MSPIPRDRAVDATLALLRDPYGFISKRCRRYGSDAFETRLMLRKTICMTGPEAAELFYDTARFTRRGATPGRIQKTLFGQGGVQGLDAEAHRNRKGAFLSLMTPERLAELVDRTGEVWLASARKWTEMKRVVLYEEVQEVLTRSVCAWAGIPLRESEVRRRTRNLVALFDDAGAVGPRHWRSRLARRRADRWIEGVVRRIRDGRLKPAEGTAAQLLSEHRAPDDELLSSRTAAVEILNVLRPTVAVAVYITFIAHALHRDPAVRRKLEAGEEGYAELVVQEVRRFYPFFPSVMARVRDRFEWNGYAFPAGRRVVLDLYGTNHDTRTWDEPEAFRPERFRDWDGSPFNFIPQGGGDHAGNHRCPGEWITIELMKQALEMLTLRLSYEVPDQDLRIDESRLPALPRSRFLLRNVTVRA